MSGGRSVGGFDIRAFITRIIPGLIIISPVFVGVLVTEISIPNLGLGNSLVLLALTGLFLGELIDMIRSTLVPVPTPFNQVLYQHTQDSQILSFWDRADLWAAERLSQFAQLLPEQLTQFVPSSQAVPSRLARYVPDENVGRRTVFEQTDRNFQEEFEDQFELRFDTQSAYALYSTFLSYMESRMSERTRRFQTLRIFSQNLMIASVLSALPTIWVIFQNLENPLLLLGALVSMGLLLLVVEVAIFVSSVAYPYIDSLIIDYYVDRVTSD